MPLKPKDLTAAGLVQFPTVIGGDVPVVNLDGVRRGPTGPRRADAGQHLSRQDHQMERSGDRQAQPERQAAVAGDRRRASLRRLGHDLHLHQLSVEGEPGLEVEGRREHRRRMAGRHRRARATKASRTTSTQANGVDRLCRIRLRAAEQDDVGRHDQRRGQEGSAERRGVPGRRGERRLGEVATTITSF